MRKTSRKGWVRKLDKIVGDIVKVRDVKCVTCGGTNILQPGHLFSRVAYSTRWDLNNVFCQCQSCNFKHELDPYPLTNYYIKKFGKKAYDALHRKYVTPHKFKDFELEELYHQLQDFLCKLNLNESIY